MSPMAPIEITAAATEHLIGAGYARIADDQTGAAAGRGRLFEDQYGVALVVVYETWRSLAEGWSDDQARLVELMSAHMTRVDPKAWEGYLVLLCASAPPPEEMHRLQELRYDVTRVRKLVAAGSELNDAADVERAILPLLPIGTSGQMEPEASALDLLPKLLEEEGIDESDTDALLTAFREQRPMLDAIHRRVNPS